MIEQVPVRQNVLMGLSNILDSVFVRWLGKLRDAANNAAQKVGTVGLTAQSAAIATTAIDTPTLKAALYRVSYYARITQAATTSSSLTVTIGWTDGVACTQSGAALAGNTTATTQSGSFLVRTDSASSVTYAAAYASAGATAMQFALDVRIEAVP